MPLPRRKYKATGEQTKQALKKILGKPKPKKATRKKPEPIKRTFTPGKKDPAIGSKEREADLDAVVAKGKTGLPKRKKRQHPKRYSG
jgi:hypothetical protein